jgi:hypothetical protein
MNREDIIRMAREAGFFIKQNEIYSMSTQSDQELTEWIEHFAALVEKAVREKINDEAKAHLQELRNNFDVESTALRLHMWSQEKKA